MVLLNSSGRAGSFQPVELDLLAPVEAPVNNEDTTAEQAAAGRDLQGIEWSTLPWTRAQYREERQRTYKNYTNCTDTEAVAETLRAESLRTSRSGRYFDFLLNTRSVRSVIVHFQLRNLVWATSPHDVFAASDKALLHWNPITQRRAEALNLENAQRGPAGNAVQISTMCARDELLVAGGFGGELVVRSLASEAAGGVLCSQRLTQDDNAITNAIEVAETRSGARALLASNNDSCVRMFDAASFKLLRCSRFPWAVNYATLSPCCKLACVVGDDAVGLLVDSATGRRVWPLRGHLDYSFAAAWHPGGTYLATGNQDTTTRIWDIRCLRSSVAMLKGRMGSVRSLRYSSDGRFLAMAEPADFAHVFDVAAGYAVEQEIDLFGEISGVAFSPCAQALFVGISDPSYASLLEYRRARAPAAEL